MSEQDCEQLTLFPADFLANHFPWPGNDKARAMTVTSGRKCSELYGNSNPLGLLVKMCLVSSIWHSTRCFLTWKMQATPHNRLLFRLAASMPRINEKESALWPTLCASGFVATGHRQTIQRLADKGLITEEERRQMVAGNCGHINPEWAEWLMGYRKAFTQLLPTPCASHYKGAKAQRFVGGVLPEQSSRTDRVHSAWENWPDESGMDRVVDGIPDRVDRVKALGNAVVPQQFYLFFKLIADIENGGKHGR